jgi:hypothetical protein
LGFIQQGMRGIDCSLQGVTRYEFNVEDRYKLKQLRGWCCGLWGMNEGLIKEAVVGMEKPDLFEQHFQGQVNMHQWLIGLLQGGTGMHF